MSESRPESSPGDTLTLREAARELGVEVATLERLFDQKPDLGRSLIADGGIVLVPRSALDALRRAVADDAPGAGPSHGRRPTDLGDVTPSR